MFAVDDYVVYKRDVCRIVGVKEKHYKDIDYYTLVPCDDASLTIDVPVSNKSGLLRNLISRDEVEHIIEGIPSIPLIECNDRMIENEYKGLLSKGSHEDLIKIIKTTYLRNKKRLDEKKRLGDRDDYYFKLAERIIYNEFRIVLGLSYEETRDYIISKVEELTKKEA